MHKITIIISLINRCGWQFQPIVLSLTPRIKDNHDFSTLCRSYFGFKDWVNIGGVRIRSMAKVKVSSGLCLGAAVSFKTLKL